MLGEFGVFLMEPGVVSHWIIWVAAVVVGCYATSRVRLLNLWGTFFHEVSHGLAAAVTGGKIVGIHVQSDLSGYCEYLYRENLSRFITTMAGYTGPVIFGSLLLVGQTSVPRVSVAILLVLTMFFLMKSRNSGAVLLSLLTAATLGIMMIIPPVVSGVLVMIFAGVVAGSGLYSVVESVQINRLPHEGMSDQESLYELTGVPTMFWCYLMVFISVVAITLALLIVSGTLAAVMF